MIVHFPTPLWSFPRPRPVAPRPYVGAYQPPPYLAYLSLEQGWARFLSPHPWLNGAGNPLRHPWAGGVGNPLPHPWAGGVGNPLPHPWAGGVGNPLPHPWAA